RRLRAEGVGFEEAWHPRAGGIAETADRGNDHRPARCRSVWGDDRRHRGGIHEAMVCAPRRGEGRLGHRQRAERGGAGRGERNRGDRFRHRSARMTDLLATFTEARQRFMDLVAEVRPELHRYCARMTGSVFDGEDVVQETLAKAYYALAEMEAPPPLRPWLFRIAHNTPLHFLRPYDHPTLAPVPHRDR